MRAKRLITIVRGDKKYVFTTRDMALLIYLALSFLVLILGFILLANNNVMAAQSLFTFFGGMGLSEIINKLKDWGEEAGADEDS
ncbi:MAG: hypothetical protein QW692_00650 [Nitrososphaerota archaeon]